MPIVASIAIRSHQGKYGLTRLWTPYMIERARIVSRILSSILLVDIFCSHSIVDSLAS